MSVPLLVQTKSLASTCIVYGLGGAFHNLKHHQDSNKSVVFSIMHPNIIDVDNITEEKWKICLKLPEEDNRLESLHDVCSFEDQIKNSIENRKLGSMFMSNDLIQKIGSGICLSKKTMNTILQKDACKMFIRCGEEIQYLPTEKWHSVLRRGMELEYAILEPHKLWFLNDYGGITYRIRNMTINVSEKDMEPTKTYSFDSD